MGQGSRSFKTLGGLDTLYITYTVYIYIGTYIINMCISHTYIYILPILYSLLLLLFIYIYNIDYL